MRRTKQKARPELTRRRWLSCRRSMGGRNMGHAQKAVPTPPEELGATFYP